MKISTKKLTLGLILYALFSVTYAQQDKTIRQSEVQLDEIERSMTRFNDVNSDSKIDGSPYINENFSPIIITQNKKTYNARYNAFSREMELMIADNKIIALDPNSNYEVTFTLTNKVYRAVNYVNNNGISKTGFLVVLSENDNFSIFKEERVKFYEKVESKTSYSKEKPARYDRIDDAYFIERDEKIMFLSQNKKKFLKLFPNESSKLNTYMKKNKLNPKKEDELIQIVDYLSSIIE